MICVSLYSISLVIIGGLEHERKVDSNQLFFDFLSMSTQLWAALININSYQLNCKMLLSISMSTSIVPILAYQLFLINALNISDPHTTYCTYVCPVFWCWKKKQIPLDSLFNADSEKLGVRAMHQPGENFSLEVKKSLLQPLFWLRKSLGDSNWRKILKYKKR